MNRSAVQTAYAHQLRQYFFELAAADAEHDSPRREHRSLDSLLERVTNLPSPQREEMFVEGVCQQYESRMRRVA